MKFNIISKICLIFFISSCVTQPKIDSAAVYKKGMYAYEKSDYKLAVSYFEDSAKQGNSDAQFQLGSMYLTGDGIEKNIKKAFDYMRKAAEAGDATAQFNMGSFALPSDSNFAYSWFLKSANQGYAPAELRIGLYYYSGDKPVNQDYLEAYKWLEKSANQENSDAQYMLGTMYLSGDGVKQNHVESLEWYEKSAKNGNSKAMVQVGWSYFDGTGVDLNKKIASKYWLDAVNKGNKNALKNLTNLCSKNENICEGSEYSTITNAINKQKGIK